MTSPGSAPVPTQKTIYYAEDRCVARWPFMISGLWAPALAVVLLVVSFTQHGAVYWAFFALFMACVGVAVLFKGEWLYYFWPAGIRLDQEGVKIGGVRWAEQHPGEPPPSKATVPKQAFFVFSCPWEGVVWIWVETGKERIRIVKRHAYRGRKPTPLGNLAAPFTNAVLVIRINLDEATVPKIGPARGPLSANYSAPGYHQDRWIVPTRHPQRLKAALAALPLPDGVVILDADTGPEPATADWSFTQE